MTNEEKALNLSQKYSAPKNKNREIAVYQSAIEMAEWKGQQFKEYLEKKKADKSLGKPIEEYGMGFKDGIDYILDEIINELFNEK